MNTIFLILYLNFELYFCHKLLETFIVHSCSSRPFMGRRYVLNNNWDNLRRTSLAFSISFPFLEQKQNPKQLNLPELDQ